MAEPIYHLERLPAQLKDDIEVAQLPATHELISLSVHGTAAAPRFAVVWWPRDSSSPAQKFVFGDDYAGLTLSETQAPDAGLAPNVCSPTLVAAVGEAPKTARFFMVLAYVEMAAFVPGQTPASPASPARSAMLCVHSSALSDTMKSLREKSRVLIWACLYGTHACPFVALISEQQPPSGSVTKPASRSPIAWNHEASDDAVTLIARIGAYAQGGVRPALIAPLTGPAPKAPTPTPRGVPIGTNKRHDGTYAPLRRDIGDYLQPDEPGDAEETCGTVDPSNIVTRFFSLWHDDVIGGWGPGYQIGNWWCAFDDLDANRFSTNNATAADSGLKPIRIMGSGKGSDTRFAVIWAAVHRPAARKWSVSSLGAPAAFGDSQASDPFQQFARWAEWQMKDHGIRAGQIAIVRGGKLVCARSYRWAEAGFHTSPVSTFRIGSVSKLFTSVATWQLMEKTPGLTQFTDVATAGKLDMYVDPDNEQSALPEFQQLIVGSLLQHLSGLKRDPASAAAVKQAYKLSYPLKDVADFVRYHVNRTGNVNWQQKGKDSYSNLGYMFLQHIVQSRMESLSGGTYVDAVQEQILIPLKVTARPHPGRLGITQRASSEVLAQKGQPSVGASKADDDGALAFAAYGGIGPFEALTGIGYWIMAAVDVARFLAALRPAAADVLFSFPYTLPFLFLQPGPPPEPQGPRTPGGWDYQWLTGPTTHEKHLIVSQNGLVGGGGGASLAMIQDPLGIENWGVHPIGVVVCFNSDSGGLLTGDAIWALSGFLDKITGDEDWPEDDLFDLVVDP